jgi:hypothetical protein
MPFSEGLARVRVAGRWGFIDANGKMLIKPQFDDAKDFDNGLAAVKSRSDWGYIDKTGKMVIEPQFVYRPGDFVDGLAKVMGQTHAGFIDHAGRFSLKVEYEHSDDSYSEGLLAVIQGNPPRGVYLKRDGEVALEIPFWQQRTAYQRSLYSLRHQQLAPFSEGLAPVLSFNRLGFIDKTGKVVIEPLFRETKGFSEGLAAVKIIDSDGQYVWGYIDRTGRFAIAPRFSEAHTFAGGLAQVTTTDGKKQLIDESGKVIWKL